MAQVHQTKKRKTSAKEVELKTKKLTPQEIAFINRTKLPPEPKVEVDSKMEKAYLELMDMFLRRLMEFMEMYGGYYSRRKIMEMYGMSKNTLGNWIKLEGLPHYQVGKKILVKKSEIEEFLKKYRKVMPVTVGLCVLL